MPGAPLFFLAMSYAARSVSSLPTCTYRPQNRHSFSAFALTYSRRRRSCRLMGAVVMAPLPPMLVAASPHSRAPSLHGRYPASSLLRTRPPPSRLRPTSRVRRLYGLPDSAAFAAGRGGVLHLVDVAFSPGCLAPPP